MAPTGRPSAVVPTGTEIDGWPVAQKGAVFGTISKARATISSRGAPGGGRGVVAIGVVGMSKQIAAGEGVVVSCCQLAVQVLRLAVVAPAVSRRHVVAGQDAELEGL